MNLYQNVSSMMISEVVTLPPDASISEASTIFRNHKIHHIPIVKEDKLVGIVSKSDYLFFKRGFIESEEDRNLEEIRLHNYSVSYIMTKSVEWLKPSDRIELALNIFRKNEFHALPVVFDERLVGIITTHDILEILAINHHDYAG